MITVARLLTQSTSQLAHTTDSPRLDAEVLLAWALSLPRTSLVASANAQIDQSVQDFFRQVIRLRQRSVPVAYITGRQPFMDIELIVTPDTLVPRPFTETLVQAVLDTLGSTPSVIADIGTGSGAIAIAIAHYAPNSRVIGTDQSVAALRVAAANARRHDLLRRIDWRAGYLLDPLRPQDQVETVVANLPYLPARDLSERSIRHEPQLALDGGADGLRLITQLLSQLHRHPSVRMIALELLPEQVDRVAYLLRSLPPGNFQVDSISDGQQTRGLLAGR